MGWSHGKRLSVPVGWKELRKVWGQAVPEAVRPRQAQAQRPGLLEAVLASLSKATSRGCPAGAAAGPGTIVVIMAVRMREAVKARTQEQMERPLIPGPEAPTPGALFKSPRGVINVWTSSKAQPREGMLSDHTQLWPYL